MENSASGEIQQEANSSIKSENTEIPEKSRTSSGNENQNEQRVIDMATMLRTSEIPVSDECRIYKVPNHLRKGNEEAYTPCVISIGPYHHNNKNFQTMEKHKERYSNSFMQRTEMNLDNLVTTVKEMEDIIRQCYVDCTVELEGYDFVNMIMLDAIFILELFLKVLLDWTRDDHMFVEAWRYGKVKHDLLLLENQLPFFVLKKLYQLALPSLSNSVSLIRLTFNFFEYLNIHSKAPEGEIKHFTDLLRFFQLPPHHKLPERGHCMVFPKYSATQLHEVGVKFKVAPNTYVLDVSFFKKGVLEIPPLELDNSTEAYVRNIMALEHCDYSGRCFFTDFFLILDRLIITGKDVDLLCDYGIIRNYLGDSNASNAVASMIKNLNKGIAKTNMNSNFCRLCEDLNAFCENPWHRMKAKLRRQYWTAVSTGAIILTLLTLLQTVCSIIQIVPIVKSL